MGLPKIRTWSEEKEEFEKTLNNARSVSLNIGSVNASALFAKNAPKSGEARLKELEAVEQFLSNLEELKSFFPEKDEKIFVELLNKAGLALRDPDSDKYRK